LRQGDDPAGDVRPEPLGQVVVIGRRIFDRVVEHGGGEHPRVVAPEHLTDDHRDPEYVADVRGGPVLPELVFVGAGGERDGVEKEWGGLRVHSLCPAAGLLHFSIVPRAGGWNNTPPTAAPVSVRER